MNITGANLRAIEVGFNATFNEAFQGTPVRWDRVAMSVTSGHRSEVYGWLGTFPQMREWIGDRVLQNLGTHDWTIKNKSYEGTVEVDRDDIEDDTLGIYTPQIRLVGEAARKHPDKLIFKLLKDGFATNCYDGQYFFDTDHTVNDVNGVAQSVSNFGGGSGTPWYLIDASRAIKPFVFQQRRTPQFIAMDALTDEAVFMRKKFRYGVDYRGNVGYGLWQLAWGSKTALDVTNYSAARAAMMSFTADGGDSLDIIPNLIVVPPTLEGAANALVKAQKDAAGADNIWFGTADVLVVPTLAQV